MRTFLHPSVRPRYLIGLLLIVSLALVQMRHSASPSDYLIPPERTNGEATLRAFAVIGKSAESAVVRVLSNEKTVALGTIVSSLYIVTKASEIDEIEEPLEVILPDGRQTQADRIAKDSTMDLALLRVSGESLTPVLWGQSEGLRIGDWLISPGQENRFWVGVMSAQRRKIKRVGGALGVRFMPSLGRHSGVEILDVVKDSPADLAGIQIGDTVLGIEDQIVRSNRELIDQIQKYDPGDAITLQIVRERMQMSIRVRLGFYSVFDHWNRNQRMSGATSDRRNGFPEVIQHVIPLTPDSMGGPLLNLRGETLGINIARADRVTTYAIPAERVIQSIRQMLEDAKLPHDL